MKKSKRYYLIFNIVLLSISFWVGRISFQWEKHLKIPDVLEMLDIENIVPMVIIDDIKDAKIFGRVNTSYIRIRSGERVIIPREDLTFILPIDNLGFIGKRRPIIKVRVPEWAKFVASKNGKYFYSLDKKQAKRLSLKSRIYFRSEINAEEAGYKKRKK